MERSGAGTTVKSACCYTAAALTGVLIISSGLAGGSKVSQIAQAAPVRRETRHARAGGARERQAHGTVLCAFVVPTYTRRKLCANRQKTALRQAGRHRVHPCAHRPERQTFHRTSLRARLACWGRRYACNHAELSTHPRGNQLSPLMAQPDSSLSRGTVEDLCNL